MAASLERQQGGEQFRLLDPARLPERPIYPNRPGIIFMGLAIGVGIGIGIVALLEYRDHSLRTDDDVMLTLALPVLAVIPVMSTRAERAAARRRRLMVSAATAATFAFAAALIVWKFIEWRTWLPW
jgi:polysaccharide biosynthesis transport protein